MNRKLLMVTGLLTLIAICFYFISNFSKDIFEKKFLPSLREESLCETMRIAKNESFRGVLIKKFKDKKNHNYKTALINQNGELLESTIFVLDETDAYDYLKEGDSIIKEENSLLVKISRHTERNEFELYYGCEKNPVTP